IADRAAATSSAVTRRACSKGNSPRFFIAPSLPPARRPSADDSVDASGLPDSEDHDQDSTVSGSDQPTSLLAHRMNEVRRHKSKGVVESSNCLLEADSMLDQVRCGLLRVPIEPHFQYTPELRRDVEGATTMPLLDSLRRRTSLPAAMERSQRHVSPVRPSPSTL